MCYSKADQVMQDIERRWVNAKASLHKSFFPDIPLDVAKDMALEDLDARLMELDKSCCLDVHIALSEDISRAVQVFKKACEFRTKLAEVAA